MADYTARNLKYRLYGPGNEPVSGATITATLLLPGGEDLRFGEDLPIIEQPHRVLFTEDADTPGLYGADLIPNTDNLENSRYRIEQQTGSGTTDFYISMPDEDVAPGATLEIEDIHEVGELSQEAVQPTVLRRLYDFLRATLGVGAGLTITRDDANRRLTLNIQGGAVTTTHIADRSVTKAKLDQTLENEIDDTVNDVLVSGRDVAGSKTGGGSITGGTISPPSKTEVFEHLKTIFQNGLNTIFRFDNAAQTAQVDGEAGGDTGTTLTADEQSKVKRLLLGTTGGTWSSVADAVADRRWASSIPAPPSAEVLAATFVTSANLTFFNSPAGSRAAFRIPVADKPGVSTPGLWRVAVTRGPAPARPPGAPQQPAPMSLIPSADWMHVIDSGAFAYYWAALPEATGTPTFVRLQRNSEVVLNDASSPASIARDSELPQPSDATPNQSTGAGAAGGSDDYARADHTHPAPAAAPGGSVQGDGFSIKGTGTSTDRTRLTLQ